MMSCKSENLRERKKEREVKMFVSFYMKNDLETKSFYSNLRDFINRVFKKLVLKQEMLKLNNF